MEIFSSDPEFPNIPGLDRLTDEEKSVLKKSCFFVDYKAGEVIFREKTPVTHLVFLQSGLAKLFQETRDGSKIIISLFAPGSYLGLLTALGDDIYLYSAAAVENAKAILINVSQIRSLVESNGAFAIFMLEETSRRGKLYLSKFIIQSTKHMPGRVAGMLLFFSEKIYNSRNFLLPLSRTELAEFSGTTKESIIRTLSEFKHDKIINIDDKKVEIISCDLLQKLSEFG